MSKTPAHTAIIGVTHAGDFNNSCKMKLKKIQQKQVPTEKQETAKKKHIFSKKKQEMKTEKETSI